VSALKNALRDGYNIAPRWGAPCFLYLPSPVGWAEELRTFGATAGGKMWVIARTEPGVSGFTVEREIRQPRHQNFPRGPSTAMLVELAFPLRMTRVLGRNLLVLA
jgi:hypothetical protein